MLRKKREKRAEEHAGKLVRQWERTILAVQCLMSLKPSGTYINPSKFPQLH